MKTNKPNPWILFALMAILELVALAFFDWKYFFPIKDHTDLSFQLTGEAVAYIVSLLVIIAWQRCLSPHYRNLSVWVRFPISGFLGSLMPIAFVWRSLFEGHHFLLGHAYLFPALGVFSALGISEFARDLNSPRKKTGQTAVSS